MTLLPLVRRQPRGQVRHAGTGDKDPRERERASAAVLVDDEADARQTPRVVLGKRGAEVRTAAGSAQALDCLAQWIPDVLVSDIGMPGQDGYALIQRVRALPRDRGGRMPAAALTAYVRPQDRMRALAAGFQAHVPKPVDPDELARSSRAWRA